MRLMTYRLQHILHHLPRDPHSAVAKATRAKCTRRMSSSTFNLPSTSIAVEVGEQANISESELLGFPAFKNWLSTLRSSLSRQSSASHPFHAEPYSLRRINVQSVDRFGDGSKVGFVKLTAEVSNASGEKLPGSVFLRGSSVAMMLLLQPDDVPEGSDEDKHVVFTIQARIPAGSLTFVELPAGMTDDEGNFAGSAAKEIKEELGIEVPGNELVDLTRLALEGGENEHGETLQMGVYPSAGGCDEFIPVFLHQKRVKRDQLSEWTGKLTGLRDEGEKITLKCVPLAKAWKEGARDAKLLSALALYHGLKGEGKI